MYTIGQQSKIVLNLDQKDQEIELLREELVLAQSTQFGA